MGASLPVRQLGTTDMNITRVGFGAWAIGGSGWSFAWGPQDDNESIAAMNHAVEVGVNWVDTAAVYGLGHSEEVVGRFLKGRSDKDRPYIFTKCGLVWDPNNPMAEPKRILSPDSIRHECEDSLRRLKIDRIDLYQFHWPDDASGTPVEASWRVMEDLQKQGKVRAIGVSNFDLSGLKKIDPIHHVQSLQPPFSLIRRDAATTEIPWCNATRTGVIVYSPMQSGILTDSFTIEKVKKMDDNDWRRRSANFQTPRIERNIALRNSLKPIAERHGTTVSAVAVAWTLAWPGVTGAIVGARSPSQIDGWIDGASLTLTSADLNEIAAAIEKTGAGTGPTRPPSPQRKERPLESPAEAR